LGFSGSERVRVENFLFKGLAVIFVAYLLSVLLVPLLAAVGILFTMPLVLIGGKNSPRLVAVIQGIVTGLIASWGCQKIFFLTGTPFTSTPLWVLGFLFLLNDWNRIGKSGTNLPEIGSQEMEEMSLDNSKLDGNMRSALVEVGNLVGTPIGFYLYYAYFKT